MDQVKFKPTLEWIFDRSEMLTKFDPSSMSEWAVEYRKKLYAKLIQRAWIIAAEEGRR